MNIEIYSQDYLVEIINDVTINVTVTENVTTVVEIPGNITAKHSDLTDMPSATNSDHDDRYVQQPIPVTNTELYTLKNNSQLVPGQWYCITDYATYLPIISGDGTFHTGDTEEILVRANCEQVISSQGFSKTHPDEIIYFEDAIINYTGSFYTYYSYGTLSTGFDVTIVNDYQLNFDTTLINDKLTDITIYIGDDVSGQYITYYFNERNITWTFDDVTKIFTPLNRQELSLYYEEGTQYGDIEILAVTSNTIQFDRVLEDTSIISNIYLEDWVNGGYVTLDASNYGTTWTLSGDTITILESIVDFDLEEVFSSGYIDGQIVYSDGTTNTDYAFLTDEFELEITGTYTKDEITYGHITARHNTKRNLYVDEDYRGRLHRRYKADVTTWSAGTYNNGDFVRYSDYIWKCIGTTTATPSTSTTNYYWVRLFRDEYVMSNDISISGHTLYINTADYEDTTMFNLSTFDTETQSILALSIYTITSDCDIVFRTNTSLNNCKNNTITMNGSGYIYQFITNSYLTLNNVIINNINDSSLSNCQNSVIHNLDTVNIDKIDNSIIYLISDTNIKSIDRSNLKYTVNSRLGQIVTTSFAGSPNTSLDIFYSSNTTFYRDASNSKFTNCYNNTFNGEVLSTMAFGRCNDNTIGEAFSGNIIYSFFYNNNIYRCSSNVFYAEARNNTFNNSTNQRVTLNQFFGNFSYNSSGTSTGAFVITSNIFNDFCSYNSISSASGSLTITNNLCMGKFNYNIVNGNYACSIISNNMNGIFGGSGASTNYYATNGNVTIGSTEFGSAFLNNKVYRGSVSFNKFYGECRDNEWYTSSSANFWNNICYGEFRYNTIQSSNVTGNEIGATFNSNTISAILTFNKIQPNVTGVAFSSIMTGQTYPALNIQGNLTVSTLTATRVPFASTSGLLVDDADLTFSGDTLTATKVKGQHLSSDGTAGITQTITFNDYNDETHTLVFKDGVLTSYTAP